MKLNKKGFAISSVMYSLLILAVSLMFGILAVIISRKMTLDKIKDKVRETVNGGIASVSEKYFGLSSKIYTPGESVKYAGLNWFVVKDNGNSVTLVLDGKIGVTGHKYNNYKDDLENFLNQNILLNMAKDNNYLFTMNFTGGSGKIRALQLRDIYGSNPLPDTLSKDDSIITDCKFCAVNYDSYLLNELGDNAFTIAYSSDDNINYLSLSNGAGYVRPVITVGFEPFDGINIGIGDDVEVWAENLSYSNSFKLKDVDGNLCNNVQCALDAIGRIVNI